MPPLRVSADEFRAIADGVNRLVADFLSDLEERRTVSATSTTDTAAFDLPLPEEGVGEAALRDLEAISEHLRAPTGAVSRTCSGRETRSGRWATSTRR
jgi:hypothetical protein